MNNRPPMIIIAVIILIAIFFASLLLSDIFPKGIPKMEKPPENFSHELKDFNSSPNLLPHEIRQEIQQYKRENFTLNKWEFDLEKSKEAIRKFTNIPDQNLTFNGIMNESYAEIYVFKSGNSSYWVNNLTGRVQSALWYDPGSKNKNEIIDLDQGLKIAEPYAKEKYPELWNVTDKRGIQQTQKTDTRGNEKVFVYIWQEIFYNPDNKTIPHSEIPGLNSVTIEINPYTSRVTKYHELYTQSEVIPNLTVTISEEQARMSAALYFESTGIPDVRQSELISNGLHVSRDNDNNQRLTWSFSLTRTDKIGFDTGGVVGIDAHDGHVVYHATF